VAVLPVSCSSNARRRTLAVPVRGTSSQVRTVGCCIVGRPELARCQDRSVSVPSVVTTTGSGGFPEGASKTHSHASGSRSSRTPSVSIQLVSGVLSTSRSSNRKLPSRLRMAISPVFHQEYPVFHQDSTFFRD